MANGQGIGHAGEVYGVVEGSAFFSVEGACGVLPSAVIATVEKVLGGSSLVAGWLFITSKCLVGSVGGEILGLHSGGAIAITSTDLFLASALAMAFFTPCSAILTQSYGKSIRQFCLFFS
jgi:hypothetical protein